MAYTPENIQVLQPNQVFVFGSNVQGVHGAGAAFMALRWGAVMGTAKGRMGQTYAIITKDLGALEHPSIPLENIRDQLIELFYHAGKNPHRQFLVTQIGCGLGGFETADIVSAFRHAMDRVARPINVVLPKNFADELGM